MDFAFGAMLFSVAVGVSLIAIFDLSVYLMFGSKATLSQRIQRWVGGPSDGYVWLLMAVASTAFALGMLVTHFTNFRMVVE